MKKLPLFLSCALAAGPAFGANIVWVTDNIVQAGSADVASGDGFTPGTGPYADDGFVTLLQGAGHTVTRYNPPASTLAAGDVAQLNTFDLVIIGRTLGSSAFDSALESAVWNTQVTVPLMATNTYLTRSTRLGWFSSTAAPFQPDQILNPLTFSNTLDPVQAYLIGASAMAGSTTVDSITTSITYPNNSASDTLGISNLTGSTINAGGSVLATSFVTSNSQNSPFIATLPAGTVLAVTNVAAAGVANGQVLGGFRMQFLAGNREGAAPNNGLRNAGYENLTPEGESMFLRAVALAENNGIVPVPEPTAASMSLLALAGLLLRRRR